MAEVGVVEGGVMPAACQQRVVIALLDDGAVVHDDDAVSALHRR